MELLLSGLGALQAILLLSLQTRLRRNLLRIDVSGIQFPRSAERPGASLRVPWPQLIRARQADAWIRILICNIVVIMNLRRIFIFIGYEHLLIVGVGYSMICIYVVV